MPGSTSTLHSRLNEERLAREYRRRLASLPLMDFVPRVSPDLVAPRHLAPLVDLFEEAAHGDVRAISSVPPQHGKSVTLFHLLVRELLKDPTKRHGYGTYSIEFAQSQSLKALQIARRALLPLERETMSEWVTPQGGGIVWVGVGGQLTGLPIDGVFVADDLLKSRADAESKAIQRAAMNFLTSAVMTRLHPGASLILNATRWTPDDPSGQMIRAGWPNVNLPAINDAGEPLWPEGRPLAFLERQKRDMGEYDWWSLYQGEPRPRGGAVFKTDPSFYTALPPDPYRQAHGSDFAYTAKTHADYSVTLSGRQVGDDLFLTNMIRAQLEPRQYASVLTAAGIDRVAWYLSGTEKGLVGLLQELGIHVQQLPAVGDKFVRAQPAAARWNSGRIHLPEEVDWTRDFLDEVMNFTGVSDTHDDIVDALAALDATLNHASVHALPPPVGWN